MRSYPDLGAPAHCSWVEGAAWSLVLRDRRVHWGASNRRNGKWLGTLGSHCCSASAAARLGRAFTSDYPSAVSCPERSVPAGAIARLQHAGEFAAKRPWQPAVSKQVIFGGRKLILCKDKRLASAFCQADENRLHKSNRERRREL